MLNISTKRHLDIDAEMGSASPREAYHPAPRPTKVKHDFKTPPG